jgi:subtilisin family serine protease
VNHLFNQIYSQVDLSTQSAQSLNLMSFKQQLQGQYQTYQNEFVLKAEARRAAAAGQKLSAEEEMDLLDVKSLQHLRYDNNQLTIATLSQYVDTLLFALFETHSDARATQMKLQGTVMASLSIQDTILLVSSFIDTQLHYLSELQTDVVETLASHQDVHFVDLQLPVTISNKHLRWALQADKDQNGDFLTPTSTSPAGFDKFGPYFNAAIDGTGVVVGESDTGIDVKSCFFMDTAAPGFQSGQGCYTNHVTEHRKIKAYCAFYDNTDVPGQGHGTHVAGTIAGFQRSNTGTVLTTSDHDNGSASAAQLAFFDIGDATGALALPNDLADVFRHAYSQGGRLHSASWGCSIRRTAAPLWACNSYDISSLQLDKYLYENQDYTVLMAAGNDGEYAYGTIGSAAIAKNALVVGALAPSKTAAAQVDSRYSTVTTYQSDPSYFQSSDVVASFSNMGPSFDDRVKPDIMAPGQFITSARSGTGGAETCLSLTISGTSMATPAVSGTLGLMEQMLKEGRQYTGVKTEADALLPDEISNSLLKSLVINSGQTVKYRGITEAAANMPEPSQPVPSTLAPLVEGDISYTNIPLGQYNSVIIPNGAAVNLYIKSASTSSSAPTHTFRVMVLTPCSSASLILAGVVSNAQIASKTFPFENESTLTRTFLDLTGPKAEPITLRFTASSPNSCGGNEYLIIVTEFASDTVGTAPRYQEIGCKTTIHDFPTWGLANLLTPSWVYSCPPAPACTDANEPAAVVGTNFYTTQSPICKVALHAGTVNATSARLTGADAAFEIANGKRQFVRLEFGALNEDLTMAGIEHNGVKSNSLLIKAGDIFLATAAAGAPFEYQSGGQTATNSYLYLQPLPAGPNSVAGFGKAQLGAVLPLHQNLPAETSASNARQLLIFTNRNRTGDKDATNWDPKATIGTIPFHPEDAKYSALTHLGVQSYCFLVPPTAGSLVNSYTYKYTDEGTETTSAAYTAGPDDLRVTLSWYDFPGSNMASKVLVNDLDLHVFAPNGAEYRGNDRADHRNNVERVVIGASDAGVATHLPGMYCAVVHGVYVPMGIQRYSLV